MSNLVLIKHPSNWGLEEKLVERLAKTVLREKKLDGVELSLVFVGRKRARDLNVRYRGMSYVPQVLGFPMDKETEIDGLIHLGDVVICTNRLKREGQEILIEWLRHGVQNLLK